MGFDFAFFMGSIAFGTGLAMDAFSVSLANGLGEPRMRAGKMCGIAGLFAFFQALMPIIGWGCVHTLIEYFPSFEKFVPWIALVLLLYIGGKMLIDGIKNKDCKCDCGKKLSISALILQGIATSIDALSVGVEQATYNFKMELVSSLVIAAVTFVICMAGVFIGKKFGTKLAGKASILGGVILIFIGINIFLKGIL